MRCTEQKCDPLPAKPSHHVGLAPAWPPNFFSWHDADDDNDDNDDDDDHDNDNGDNEDDDDDDYRNPDGFWAKTPLIRKLLIQDLGCHRQNNETLFAQPPSTSPS